jgi:hypothetical protein
MAWSCTTKRLNVSSTEVLVFIIGLCAGTTIAWAPASADCGDFNAAITNCSDVSPGTDSFPINDDLQHSVSGRMLSLAASADGQRLYAGSFSGVWRSDDAGVNWHQLTRPQPPPSVIDLIPSSVNTTDVFGTLRGTDVFAGALRVPNVFDVVVSPVNKDLVFAATGFDTRIPAKSENGIYRSSNGGDSWRLVHQFNCAGSAGPARVGQIVFAPDNPLLMYAAGGCAVAISRDAGLTWIDAPLPGGGTVWHLAVAPRQGSFRTGFIFDGTVSLPDVFVSLTDVFGRRVYGAGDDQIWYSRDEGSTWIRDLSSTLPSGLGFGGFPDPNSGNSAHVLVVEPGHPDHVYLAVPGLANGPSYYQPSSAGPDGILCNSDPRRFCGEGSVWLGDYSTFSSGLTATWTQQPGPPAYFWGSTDSGNVYVETKTTPRGYLLFFSDRSHVHVSAGRPTAQGWHRLDGRDASQGRCEGCVYDENGSPGCNKLFLHVDPHAFAISSDFDMTLTD